MNWSIKPFARNVFSLALLLSLVGTLYGQLTTAQAATNENSHLVTIHDRGKERSVISTAKTMREVFMQENITIDPNDIVEPGLDEALVAPSYQVNVYRARPITIIDGTTKIRVMSAYQTPKQIVKDVGLSLQDEDKIMTSMSTDIVSDGASMKLAIERATPITLMLYGKTVAAYTQGANVAEVLKEKNIILTQGDSVSIPLDTSVARGMEIQIWRDGVQTVTLEETIEPPVKTIMDMNHPVGYQVVTTEGARGARSVTYEVVAEGGREVERREIQSVIVKQPQNRVVTVGAKTSSNPLTKSKGAHHFVDSNGVSHRETYYDLPMSVVMKACGAGGIYSVRASDGAKVDKDGYIIIAANLGNYPRCSVVETSMGLGKVYDTGGFAVRHPHGFDLATDWTNGDGR